MLLRAQERKQLMLQFYPELRETGFEGNIPRVYWASVLTSGLFYQYALADACLSLPPIRPGGLEKGASKQFCNWLHLACLHESDY